MNKKENWLRLIRSDNPGWIGLPWEAFRANRDGGIFTKDPVSQSINPGTPEFGSPKKDAWGVNWMRLPGTKASNPHITAENKALQDITKWRETVVFPPLDGHDWTPFKEAISSINRKEYLTMSGITGGLFERTHFLMGFEDALCNYIVNQEAMYDLLGAIADWKLGHLERIIDNLHPDVILFHDDWGSKSNLFLPPDVWRKIIKPHHQRIVDYVKSRGLIFIHHADCFCKPIVVDMAEMGIDVWQGVIPQNDILSIQKKLDGGMVLIGGIDAALIDKPDADEQTIRKEVRRCIDTYCPNKYFIPCIPNVIPIFPEVKEIYHDELIRHGIYYFKHQ